MTKKLPSQTMLLTLFRYDARRGVLRRWNSRRPCGRKVSIDDVDFWSARVAWKMVTGREPRDVIKFLDGDSTNMKFSNLVELTTSELRATGRSAHRNSSTRERNIQKTKAGTFMVVLRWQKRKISVGTFKTLTEAIRARDQRKFELIRGIKHKENRDLRNKRSTASPRAKFGYHRENAKSRGIPFHLTFEQWWDVWKKSGKWEKRGKRIDDYVMCRNGDRGAYEIGNVRIATVRENIAEAKRQKRGL